MESPVVEPITLERYEGLKTTREIADGGTDNARKVIFTRTKNDADR